MISPFTRTGAKFREVLTVTLGLRKASPTPSTYSSTMIHRDYTSVTTANDLSSAVHINHHNNHSALLAAATNAHQGQGHGGGSPDPAALSSSPLQTVHVHAVVSVHGHRRRTSRAASANNAGVIREPPCDRREEQLLRAAAKKRMMERTAAKANANASAYAVVETNGFAGAGGKNTSGTSGTQTKLRGSQIEGRRNPHMAVTLV